LGKECVGVFDRCGLARKSYPAEKITRLRAIFQEFDGVRMDDVEEGVRKSTPTCYPNAIQMVKVHFVRTHGFGAIVTREILEKSLRLGPTGWLFS
jgi:hypothetical protein